jgi:hypothetical protein
MTVRLDPDAVMSAIRATARAEDIAGMQVVSAKVVIPGGGDYSNMRLDLADLDIEIVMEKVTNA